MSRFRPLNVYVERRRAFQSQACLRNSQEFDVQIVGIGVARYAREELVPRKAGHVRFAHRREAEWSALRPCSVLETTVGSHACGLAEETSDVDVRGLFALPFPWTVGLAQPPLDMVSADGSTTLWAQQLRLALIHFRALTQLLLMRQ